MFYSHEILTSRKHGVATIWLVATLGSKSTLKKISRRAILDVDVAKACETIADPDSPMALRLQSSLLYGVSRVFSQQCGYILTDMQSLCDKMRSIAMVVRDLQTNDNVTLTSDQLNLPIDPSFDFDLDMRFDFSLLQTLSEPTEQSSLLSPRSFASSQSSLLVQEQDLPQLELPSGGTPENAHFDFDADMGIGTSSIQGPPQHAGFDLDEPGIDENPLFEINDEGLLIDVPASRIATSSVVGGAVSQIEGDNPEVVNQAADEQNVLAMTENPDIHSDDGLQLLGDDDKVPPPLSEHVNPDSPMPTAVPEQAASQSPSAIPQLDDRESETGAGAPHRRARPQKLLRMDQVTELTNKQLSEWQDTYIDTMAQVKYEQANRTSLMQARRNAEFWILDQGIGGVSVNFTDDREFHPLSVFSGQTLMEALTGRHLSTAGRKRSLSAVDSEDEEEEEVHRNRSDLERDIGRGDEQPYLAENEEGILLQGDDDVESQMGRQLASSLKDQPSSMPWMINSSARGSARASVQRGFSSSARGFGFEVGLPSVNSRHRSRLTSASPLVGRGGPRLPSFGPQGGGESFDLDTEDFADPFADLTGYTDEDFELYGPAAAVSTQQAAQSQWLADALENEAQNFLLFLGEQIASIAGIEDEEQSITFAELLPPPQNSNVVAAQGILHVLALATKGLINVQQDEAFGDISLKIIKRDEEDIENGDEVAGGDGDEA